MKISLLLGLASLAPCLLLAQAKNTDKTTRLPADTTSATKVVTEDPVENAAWKRSGKNGKSEFSDSTLKNDRTVTYDATGNMVISDDSNTALNPNAYPPSIAEYFTQNYPRENYKVLWTKDKAGNKNYYINRKKRSDSLRPGRQIQIKNKKSNQ